MDVKFLNYKIIGILLLILFLCSGCSREAQIKMEFHGSDSGKNSDIGTYITAVSADFKASEICAISEEENQMTDDNLPALSAFMIDVTDNELLFSKNVYERIYPASTTKLLTALLILKYGNLSDMVTVREDNAGITVPGAKLCGFRAGDQVSLETLLNCLLVYSGNDACIAAAVHLFGSEEAFVEKMNEEAALLGATGTHFVNSHGLHHPEHYTTAYDMYLIFMECMKFDFLLSAIKQPNFRAVYLDKEGSSVVKDFETTNMFLLGTMESPQGITVMGGKTGSTGDAGDCLILLSENTEGIRYVTGVFKASSKNNLYTQIAYLLDKK